MTAINSLRRWAPRFGPARADYRCALAAADRAEQGQPLERLQLASQWLRRAQRPDGGFSRSLSLLTGKWQASYPETTGYIIPTLYASAKLLCDAGLSRQARVATDWLVGVQHAEGYFMDIAGRGPQVFDTGQCLEGLCATALATNDPVYRHACDKAIEWLVRMQNADGSWTHNTYNKTARTYYARVAAVLLSTGCLLGFENARTAGIKGLNWALRQQEPDGFFRRCHFDGKAPLLHTLGYASAALLRGHLLTGDPALLAAVRSNVKGILRSLRETGGLPVESYGSHWQPLNRTRCCAGIAQYTVIILALASLTADADLRDEGMKFLDFLMRQQITSGVQVRGALPASVPLCDGYVGWRLANWPVKFFMDAILLALRPAAALTSNSVDELACLV